MSQGREGSTAGCRDGARGARRALGGVALAFALLVASGLSNVAPALAVGTRTTAVAVDCGETTPVNAPATCTVTVTDTDTEPRIAPTGSVTLEATGKGTFSAETCNLEAPVEASASCSVKYTPTEVGTGKRTITATYGGDEQHAAGSHKSTVLLVSRRAVSVAVSCGTSAAIAQPVTCTATVADTSAGTASEPTGTITFSTDAPGGFSVTECTLAPAGEEHAACNATYTPTAAGTHHITVKYGGDTTHEPEEKTTTLPVSPRAIGVSINCGSGVAVLQPATCVATVADTSPPTRSAPTGTITFSPAEGTFSASECTLEPIDSEQSNCRVEYTPAQFGSGVHHIAATYSGDSLHEASPGSETLLVSKRSSRVALACAGPVTVGSPATCTVTVTDTSPGTASPPPGAVELSSDTGGGSFTPSPSCTLAPGSAANESACQVTYTPGQVGSGTHTLTATYAGDSIRAEGAGAGTLAVSPLVTPPPPTTTTTTTTTTTPPPPPPAPTVPKCRLKARELARSIAAGHGHGRARQTPVLVVTFACDQSARVKITGSASIAASGHGRTKKKARTVKLETATAQALVGKPQPAVIMPLPSAAAKALSAHVHTLVTITFTVANEHGTGIATLKLVLVPLSQLKKSA